MSSPGPAEPTAPRRRPLVLLDANALFLPGTVGFPLDAEIERLVPGAHVAVAESVRRELERLVATGEPRAALARTLATRYDAIAESSEGDEGVVACAARERAVVVTADRALRARLLALGLDVLSPRDRHRLERTRGRARDNG
ncbi:MAG TPA: hypothetical protein VEL82_02280 [Thermoplasmata archaeon]|nr:hypothetical protein [Thermoplasmata archaeon]